MVRTLLFFFIYSLHYSAISAQGAPESNPHRGIYIDHFLKTLPSGEIDPAFSVLSVDTNRDGIFEKEDAILQYCSENHITYVAPYDLFKILGRNKMAWNENTRQYEDLEKHFCRFVQKAKRDYCIDQVGAIGGSEAFFDSLKTYIERFPATEPYRFRGEQIHSPVFNASLRMVENVYPEGSREEQVAEFIKFYLRLSDLNRCGECGANIDVFNVEEEFWYSCASDYQGYADLINYMYQAKLLHNNLYPSYPVFTEAYLANLSYCTSPYSSLDVAHLCDGCSNCSPCTNCPNPQPRIIDRILMSFLTANPNYYIHSNTYQFSDSLTQDSTDFHPLLYAESIDQGGFADYFGYWFPQAYTNNIFTAEMLFYSSWRNHPYTQFGSPHESNVQPGAAMWFSKSYMIDPLKNPLAFYSTSPRCNGNGSAQVTFNYIGPPEIGIGYSFWISRDSDSAVVYPPSGQYITGIADSYLPPIGTASGRKSIEFADTSIFPICILPAGDYTAHLKLDYESTGECGYQCDQPIVIASSPKLTVWGESQFCEGGYAWLRTTPGSSYQWYRDGSIIPGAITLTYKAEQTGNYYCNVVGSGSCNGFTDTVFIQAKVNPMFHINGHCNGNNTITLIANAVDTSVAVSANGEGGLIYHWNTGETTDRITVPTTNQNYSVTISDPYSGCVRVDDITIPSTLSQNYTLSIIADSLPASSCASNGALHCEFTPAQSNPVSFVWNTGERSSYIRNLYPGTYSVISTINDVACSYFASYSLGTAPLNGPLVTAQVTPVSCHGESNGSIHLSLSGGNPPYSFVWKNIPTDSQHNPSDQNQNNLFPGTYTLYIFDSNGCRFEEKFVVPTTHSEISISINSVSPVTQCASNDDGEAIVSASGGMVPYQYQWNDPLQQTSSAAMNLPSGTWSVTVTDANGCIETELVSIPSSPPISLLACDSNVTWLNCADDTSGYLRYCIQGGTPPFTTPAPWTMPDSFQVERRNIPAGIYTVSITDANGCVFTMNESVGAPLPVSIQTITNSTTCIGCANGSIHVSSTGGIAPYQWTISPDTGVVSDSIFTDLPAGIYTLCAQDVNLCQICVQDTVFEDPTGLNVMLSDNLAFEIYPNPSGNTSHLRIVGSLSKHKLQLVIVDLTGRLIQSYEIDKSRDIELNIGSGKGMFFVGLVEKNKTTPAIWQKWFVLE